MIDVPPPSKLTTTKRRWAAERRHANAGGDLATPSGRLPPGQHLVRDWPVLDLGVQPRIAPDRWSLRVHGLVRHPFTWNWDALRAQRSIAARSDIHCVTTWSRYDNEWEGVAASTLVEAAGPLEAAAFVLLHAQDGYTTNLPLADFADPAALLAYSWSGAPLSTAHGGPVRLVVPHLYFWKSAKWLTRIEFVAQDQPGYWERNGYHQRGDPWQAQRYSE